MHKDILISHAQRLTLIQKLICWKLEFVQNLIEIVVLRSHPITERSANDVPYLSAFNQLPFKAGNFDIEDEPRSGRPIEVDCEQLKQIIDQDRDVSKRTIALGLDVCQKTIVNALERINLTFKFNHWVPHELTAEDNRKRKAVCLALLRDQRKEKILDRIVTCDEKWVYCENTSRKGGWSAPGESAGSVARRALTRRCFSVSDGILAELSTKNT
ncbi:Histone-lysine N-methyltransferase SETMAR [Araneus ventricosus]|uniref:Histone-lysine N-methyltransferase SETMAR n=1 Tax=Araneus ventricosus TaxID=182803 RepID=A0A4Y2CJ93_ARAVE|nr:Histone-lysine N-methyltransferase SETMAR [Araneus ventricosus]